MRAPAGNSGRFNEGLLKDFFLVNVPKVFGKLVKLGKYPTDKNGYQGKNGLGNFHDLDQFV